MEDVHLMLGWGRNLDVDATPVVLANAIIVAVEQQEEAYGNLVIAISCFVASLDISYIH